MWWNPLKYLSHLQGLRLHIDFNFIQISWSAPAYFYNQRTPLFQKPCESFSIILLSNYCPPQFYFKKFICTTFFEVTKYWKIVFCSLKIIQFRLVKKTRWSKRYPCKIWIANFISLMGRARTGSFVHVWCYMKLNILRLFCHIPKHIGEKNRQDRSCSDFAELLPNFFLPFFVVLRVNDRNLTAMCTPNIGFSNFKEKEGGFEINNFHALRYLVNILSPRINHFL